MIETTVLVTLLFLVVGLMLKPGAAVGVLAASMLLYPEYLRIPMGLSEMSVPRLVAIAMFFRLLAIGRFGNLSLRSTDFLIVASWIWVVFAQIVAGAVFTDLATHIGRVFDTVLMYFVARASIRSIDDVRSSLLPLGLAAVTMGMLGAIEAATQYSPYATLERFRGWTWINKVPEFRMGFLRSKASTSHSIYFGMSMLVISGFAWGMTRLNQRRFLNLQIFFMGCLGVFASLSSGPLSGLVVFGILCIFQRFTNLIKPALVLLVLAIFATELLSNRHFYDVIDRFTFSAGTAYYRGRLIEVGLSRWQEYWLVGVGSNWPHHWGLLVDGRKHVDVVNHFLLLAIYAGFVNPILYISCHFTGIRLSVLAYKQANSDAEKRLLFGWTAALIALDVASFSVGLFGPVMLLTHLLLGSIVSVSIAIDGNSDQNLLDESETNELF
jgi:hypothetical protein